MLVTVKKVFSKYIIYDQNHLVLGHIHQKHGDYLIDDCNNHQILDIKKEIEPRIDFSGSTMSGHADIVLEKNTSLAHLPRAERVTLTLGDKEYTISQSQHREYCIACSDHTVGQITNMLSCHPKLTLAEPFDLSSISLFFVSSIIMLHEDDSMAV